ncbi:hypothetical protein GBA52_006957 [Prunus armeniaca]|nr:hypothetical protein GBA52_006957 [Prunus armeniaca]
MGPVRGMKRRKKAEKKVDQNVLAAAASLSSQPQPVDWWDDFSQRITGPLSSKSEDRMKFESVLKVSRKTFSYICSLVKEDMMTSSSNFSYSNGKQLSLNDQVAVALRRLSSDEMPLSHHHDSGYRQQTCESADNTASLLREKLALYLSGEKNLASVLPG